MNHKRIAEQMLNRLDNDATELHGDQLIAAAQVHAILALADAVRESGAAAPKALRYVLDPDNQD